jgi:hypothetical protein
LALDCNHSISIELNFSFNLNAFFNWPLLIMLPFLSKNTLSKKIKLNLNKLEDILGESEYVVRYERGNFQSGWCLLESRRIVVLNKFLNLEARINTLLELIPQLDIQFDKLTHNSQKVYEEVKKLSLTAAE